MGIHPHKDAYSAFRGCFRPCVERPATQRSFTRPGQKDMQAIKIQDNQRAFGVCEDEVGALDPRQSFWRIGLFHQTTAFSSNDHLCDALSSQGFTTNELLIFQSR